MTNPIPLNLAVEDALSEAVARRLLQESTQDYAIGSTYGLTGSGYLRKMTPAFNNASKGTPFLMMTDLNHYECPPELMAEWLTRPKHGNLLFRIAVRETEAWLLADRRGFANFLGVRVALIPENADQIPHPKEELVSIAARSPRKELRVDIVPKPGSTSKVGPTYNGRLILFVNSVWDIHSAEADSPSLAGALRVLREFQPTWAA